MKRFVARFGVLLLAVMGLVGSMTTPAHATGAAVVVFAGTATVGNGIAYPCLGQGTPSGLPAPLPPKIPQVDLTKCPPAISGNTAATTFAGQGVGAGVWVNKGKDPVEVGLMNITAAGTTTGACGLSTGLFNGNMTPVIAPLKNKPRTFTITYTGVGGNLIITGSTTKGEGLIGVALAIPTGGSCLNKQPKTFTVIGVIVVTNPRLV